MSLMDWNKAEGQILVDKMERQPAVVRLLEEPWRIRTERELLGTGDYAWRANGIRYLWETKWSPNDFYQSFFEGRLKDQIARLVRECDVPVLGLVGVYPQYGWTEVTLERLYWQYRNWGIQVVTTNSLVEMVTQMATSYEMSQQIVGGPQRAQRSWEDKSLPRQAMALGTIPGVGPKTAGNVLKVKGSLRRVADDAPSGLETATTPAIAKKIHDFMNEEVGHKFR